MPGPTPFPYHYQDRRDFCGPACLMMVEEKLLSDAGVVTPLTGLYQSSLMGVLDAARGNIPRNAFATAPIALAVIATARLNVPPTGVRYEEYPLNLASQVAVAADDCLSEIRNRITATGAPVFVLIYSGGHWAVVHDYLGDDFMVCSPEWKKTLQEVQQVHAQPCPACAGGRETVFTSAGLRRAIGRVSPSYPATIYTSKRVLVAPVRDGLPPFFPPPVIPASTTAMPPPPVSTNVPGAGLERKPAISEAAAKQALKGGALNAYASLFQQHAEIPDTAQIGDPIFVRHLEEPDEDYYLVPIFTNSLPEPWFVAQVAADTGELLRLDCIREQQPDLDSWIYAVLNEEQNRKLSVLLKPYLETGWISSGKLVWKYCRHSLSPLLPFHLIQKDGVPGYMDVQGNVHTSLPQATYMDDAAEDRTNLPTQQSK